MCHGGAKRVNNRTYCLWRHRSSAREARNTNDDNRYRDDDNPEREVRQASDRAERVRQRVSFIRAAKFTRADTCAEQTGIVNEGFMPFRRHNSLKALLFTHFLLTT